MHGLPTIIKMNNGTTRPETLDEKRERLDKDARDKAESRKTHIYFLVTIGLFVGVTILAFCM